MVDKEKDSLMEDVNGMNAGDNGAGFSVSSDDLLEDGEYQEGDASGLVEDSVATGGEVHTDTEKGESEEEDEAPQGVEGPQGEASKQKGITRSNEKKSEGGNMGGGTRKLKKGMVALPKPPAQT